MHMSEVFMYNSQTISNDPRLLYFPVNLVYDQNLRGTATMSAIPYRGQGAVNAIDGDTAIHHPCTSIDVSGEYEHVWWKVWMQRTFNVAELKIYFEATSKVFCK